MTAQLPDTVDYRGTELTLARARGTGLFDPKDHALPVAMASTLPFVGSTALISSGTTKARF